MDCLFCNIITQKIKTPFVYEDSEIVAFQPGDEDVAAEAEETLKSIK